MASTSRTTPILIEGPPPPEISQRACRTQITEFFDDLLRVFARLRLRQRQEFALGLTKGFSHFDTRIANMWWTLHASFDSLVSELRQQMRFRVTSVRASSAIVRLLLSSCVAIAAAAPHASAAAGQSPRAAAIRSISIKSNGATFVVVIEGTGALPMPTSGVAQGPP